METVQFILADYNQFKLLKIYSAIALRWSANKYDFVTLR
jgi:hypothetical protein